MRRRENFSLTAASLARVEFELSVRGAESVLNLHTRCEHLRPARLPVPPQQILAKNVR